MKNTLEQSTRWSLGMSAFALYTQWRGKMNLVNIASDDFGNAGERNVSITCSTRSLAIVLFALTLSSELLELRIAAAAPLDHFVWSTVPSPQKAEHHSTRRSQPVTVRAA